MGVATKEVNTLFSRWPHLYIYDCVPTTVQVGEALVFVLIYNFLLVVSISKHPGPVILTKVTDVPLVGAPAFVRIAKSLSDIFLNHNHGLNLVKALIAFTLMCFLRRYYAHI